MRRPRKRSDGKTHTPRNNCEMGKMNLDSILQHDEIFMQPWFIPKHIYSEIRRLLPNVHLSKMRYYFEDYGGLKCGERKSLYGANGLCEKCTGLIRGRVARALQRRLKDVGEVDLDPGISGKLGDGMIAAQALLRNFGARRSTRSEAS